MNGQNPENQNNNPNTLNANVLGTINGIGGQAPSSNPMPTPNVAPPNANMALNNPTPTPGPVMGTPVASTPMAPVSPVGPMEPQIAPTPNVEAPVVNNVAPTNAAPSMANVISGANPVPPQPQPTQAPNPVVMPSEPVAVPIPGTEGTPGAQNLTQNTVGSGSATLMESASANSNGFVEPKQNNNIGIVPPPASNNEKKSKPINKVLFAILIIALIIGVAYGVYYFLNASKKVTLTPKTITMGVGTALPDNIKDYANVTKGDISTCHLNRDSINPNVIGEYEYTITCGNETHKGKVLVADLSAPKVALKPAFKTATDTIKAEDFIESCTDDTGDCESSFIDESSTTNLTEGGPYTIKINSKDKNGNATESEGELYIVKYPVDIYTSCSLSSENVEGYQATKVLTDTFPLGHSEVGDIVFLQVSRRDYKYTFTSEEDYKKVIGDKEKNITFDDVTGIAIYDDENLTLTISTNLPWDNSIPAAFQDFLSIYNNKGYICSTNKDYNR